MNRNEAGGRGIMTGAFVFVLLGMFALFSTFLVLVCAQAYRAQVDAAEVNARARVLYRFLPNRVRMSEQTGALSVRDTQAGPALVFTQDDYETLVYCEGGYLREMLMSAEDDFYPEDGEALCAAQSLDVSYTDGLYTFTLADETGRTFETCVAARCARQSDGGEVDA